MSMRQSTLGGGVELTTVLGYVVFLLGLAAATWFTYLTMVA